LGKDAARKEKRYDGNPKGIEVTVESEYHQHCHMAERPRVKRLPNQIALNVNVNPHHKEYLILKPLG
jgi:hypothetical protein